MKLSHEEFKEDRCGLLKKSMYGTRDAEENLELEYAETTTEEQFLARFVQRVLLFPRTEER